MLIEAIKHLFSLFLYIGGKYARTGLWMVTLSGSEIDIAHGLEEHASALADEIALSYQISPRLNVRYFSNGSEHTDFSDGDHRIEFNYQLYTQYLIGGLTHE